MKRTVSGLALLLVLSGCALVSSLITPVPTAQTAPIVCIAQYALLTPNVEVGHDGCGNFWVRYLDADTLACQLISADGTYMQPITCPTEGDTLGKSD